MRVRDDTLTLERIQFDVEKIGVDVVRVITFGVFVARYFVADQCTVRQALHFAHDFGEVATTRAVV